MSAYSLDLTEKIVESVKKGVPKAETARRFGVDRATIKRYCKRLDERGTLEPGRAPKLDEKARKLPLGDLEERPWATHSQRAEFLFAVCGDPGGCIAQMNQIWISLGNRARGSAPGVAMIRPAHTIEPLCTPGREDFPTAFLGPRGLLYSCA
jgi:transposase-like protein